MTGSTRTSAASPTSRRASTPAHRPRSTPDPGPTPRRSGEPWLRAVASLPDRERIALIRTVVDGDTAADVAKDLGVSPHRVYSLVHDGSARVEGGRRDMTTMLAEILHGEPLNERETEILAGAANGETAAQTGARLFLSPETVKSYRKRVIAKLGARNGTHAVALALRSGLLR